MSRVTCVLSRVTCHMFQVVHLAVTVYLLVSLVSDQCLESEEPDIILPIFTVFKFLFIFGQCFPCPMYPRAVQDNRELVSRLAEDRGDDV